MSKPIIAIAPLAAALAIACAQTSIAAEMAMPGMEMSPAAPSAADKKMIKSAMSAAPKKVSREATIIAMDANGKTRTLREGSNGFTCMPDNPATPGPDPMCMDKAAWEWGLAWINHKQPPAGKMGFMYMLSGGTDGSNTDPYATKPSPGNHWIKTGPHVMIVGAEDSFYDMYPKSPDPDTSVPYVMWPGTPYQHLMIPVK